jgi:uncharacterized membrane protein (DUF485 family)
LKETVPLLKMFPERRKFSIILSYLTKGSYNSIIMHNNSTHNDILISEDFKKLVSRRWIFSITLTFLMLAVYFGFILTVAYHKELLVTKISKGLTLGIPLGIGIILFAWILTGIYVSWANKIYDRHVKELKDKIIKK